MEKFNLSANELWARTLPYVVDIHEPDFDSEYDEPPDPPIWYAYVYSFDGYCLHDTNIPYILDGDKRIRMFKIGQSLEKVDDLYTVYLYKDFINPIEFWSEYSDRLYKLFKLLEEETH